MGDVTFVLNPQWRGGQLPVELWPDAERMLDRAGAKVVAIAERLCPVDEGDLVTTIRHDVTTGAAGPQLKVSAGGMPGAATGKMVDYADHVELGHGRSPEQPYLRPGLIQAARMGAFRA